MTSLALLGVVEDGRAQIGVWWESIAGAGDRGRQKTMNVIEKKRMKKSPIKSIQW
jgi:hypothetical protein